jgi:hypothetical protein
MQLSPRRELIVKREEIEKEIAALFVWHSAATKIHTLQRKR